MVKAFIVVID